MVDAAGKGLHYYERDCSVQRRHQKVIEETPCPVLDDATRHEMGDVAVRAAKAVDYRGAGTIEFLYDSGTKQFYFLEMNTRLQVEHPITELCCGVDLVRQQVLVADGQKLPIEQDEVRPRGAAIECRVYAEDPVQFLPSPGRIQALRTPAGPGVRDDSGVYPGAEISTYYDPLISKLCVWGESRALAIARMRRALGEYGVAGIESNLAFHRLVLQHPMFIEGTYDTGFIDTYAAELKVARSEPDLVAIAGAVIHAQRRAFAQRPTPNEGSSCQPSAWRRASR
jgi:acetyl-CoA carboxylase biotin carboxylase subunit